MDEMSAYYRASLQPLPPLHATHYPYYTPTGPPPAAPAAPHPGVGSQPPPPSYSHSYTLPAPHTYPPTQDEVRTLFVAGLPDDVKPREIYNLFSEFPGYESFHLKSSSQTFAFAVFSNQQSAVAAMHGLNGLMFDLEKESILYIDLAKSNSRSKRSRTDDASSLDKRHKGSIGFLRALPDSGVGSNIHMPGMSNSAYNMYQSTESFGGYDQGFNDSNHFKLGNHSATPYVPQNTTPCATLFVANLGPACTEQELTQLFSRCPGFLKLKMQNQRGVPVAFVDFKDIASSTGALNHLQGTLLYSSHDEGIRLEYAKTRMGLRKREKT